MHSRENGYIAAHFQLEMLKQNEEKRDCTKRLLEDQLWKYHGGS